jgi:ribonuclease HII
MSSLKIGIDEAGRGPLFGRVYSAAVVLPPEDKIDLSMIKDSKKFTSKKKLKQVEEYVKENAVYWAIAFEDEKTIDKINIRSATFKSMQTAAKDVIKQIPDDIEYSLMVDGNAFKPMMVFKDGQIKQVEYECIVGGDDIHKNIAAASILAKVARDEYIEDICKKHPELIERYDLAKNKGYGTKKHMDGLREYGRSEWHRQTFGNF